MTEKTVAPDGQPEMSMDEFVTAVAESMEDLEEKITEVTGIEGGDNNALVVGRVTFSPEVLRVLDGEAPLNRPKPDRDELHDIIKDLSGDEEMTGESLKQVLHGPAREEILGDGADGGGKRMNAGKLRVELVPPEWLIALADVMTQGSKKYDARNWEKGMKWSTMIGSMKRHIAKFEAGERYDGEGFNLEKGTTGCHHLAMIAWNALGLMSYDLRGIGTNDIPDDDGLALFRRVNAETSDKGNSIHDK